MSKLNDEIDRVGRFLLEETSLQEGLSLERNERQKKTLLQKVWECIESFIRVKVIISNHSLEISWWKRHEVEKFDASRNWEERWWDAEVFQQSDI